MNFHPRFRHGRAGAILLLAGFTATAPAQIPMATEPIERSAKVELYGLGQYLHSEDFEVRGPYGDLKLEMDDTGLGGFGFAYHANPFLSVRAEFMFGGATFRSQVPTRTGGSTELEMDAFLHTGRLNLDYNIINRRLTPFLTAGIGYQYLETEIKTAPPVTVCWWDPWWGWVCDTDYPRASEWDFTWNVGAGVRWDITDSLFVKVQVGANWLQYSGSSSITTQLEGFFCIGWAF